MRSHVERPGNTNTNINFKKDCNINTNTFLVLLKQSPILGLEKTVLTLSLTLSLTHNYRPISHRYGHWTAGNDGLTLP